MAGVAQTRIYFRFAWQAWHSWHGVARLGVVWARGDAAPFCVASVAQPYIHLRFTWQAWHKLTSTLVSRGTRGRRGTNSHLPSFRVAGVALMAWGACRVFHSCIDNQLHSCSTLLRPGTFPLCHHRRMHTYIHTCMHTYIHAYIHTYMPTYHFTYIHTYLPTYIHTYIPTILPSRSFTTSFVFPSFPVPAKTIEVHFRKKLTCGVIRSFNFILHHLFCPFCFLRAASTTVSDYWKKLTCRVIRSFDHLSSCQMALHPPL